VLLKVLLFFWARGRPSFWGGRRYAAGLALRSALRQQAGSVWPSATHSAALGHGSLRSQAAAPPIKDQKGHKIAE